ALTLVTAVLLAAPNASESAVWGLAVNFYMVLLGGLIAVALLTRETGSPVRCVAGIAAATLAFLSLASGAMVFLACAVVVAAKLRLGVEPRRRRWLMVAALLACFAVALWLTPVVARHAVYRAHSLGTFIHAFASIAAWPFRVHLIAASLLVNAPLV